MACKHGALEAGALRAVTAAMRAHKENVHVVTMACGMLANIANGDVLCQA